MVRWSGNQTNTELTATMLERFEVLSQSSLEDKKWGGYGRHSCPYGAGPVDNFKANAEHRT